MTTRFVPNLLPKGGQSFDFLGALMLTITLLAFSMGMTISQEEGFNNAWVVGLLLVTVLGLVVFIKVEQRVAAPMIKLSLFRNILFSINLFTAVCAFIVLSSNILHPFYLEIVAGYSVREVGLIIGTFPIMLAVLAPTAGTFSDRFGTRPITVLGLSLTLIACLGLSTLDEDSSLISFIAWLMLLGGGIGVFQSPNNSAVMGAVPPDQLGVASGLLATSRNIGQMIGLPLLGTVFAARVFDLAGNTNDVGDAPPFAIVGGIHVVFLLSAFIILVALLTALGGVWLERRQA